MEDDRRQLREWAAQHWSADLALRAWWQALAESGWAFPSWPAGLGGRARSPKLDAMVRQELAMGGWLPPPDGLGQMMGAPVLIDHGTEAQRRRHLPVLARGAETWCQLFSEPAAGSDLAAVRTTAIRDGDRWVVSGQKVWTSGAHLADRGLLLARTDWDAPKHRGLTYFVVDMDQPGVTVRALRDMRGEAFFNEVFLDDAVVSDDDRIGEVGQGWPVALATLAYERAGLAQRHGVGPQSHPLRPGRRAGLLDQPVGSLLHLATPTVDGAASPRDPSQMLAVVAGSGRGGDPLLRDSAADLHIRHRVTSLLRARSAELADPAMAPLNKLAAVSLTGPARDLAASALGAEATLAGGSPAADAVVRAVLSSPSATIAGGTNEVQRNIIGERSLGLPREPDVGRDAPFRDVPS